MCRINKLCCSSSVGIIAGETGHRDRGPDPLECLQTAARCYGTALKYSPQSLEAHISLGLVMEEFFYAKDFFGLKRAVSLHVRFFFTVGPLNVSSTGP